MSRPMRCLHRVRTFGAIYTQCDNTIRDGHPSRLIERHAPRDQAEVWELVGEHLQSTGVVR